MPDKPLESAAIFLLLLDTSNSQDPRDWTDDANNAITNDAGDPIIFT